MQSAGVAAWDIEKENEILNEHIFELSKKSICIPRELCF
jgi:hypothetical protein